MSDDMLSQDEIDALLRGGNLEDEEDQENEFPETTSSFSEIERDALGEIGNISFGSSATALSTLLNQKVEITTPTVSTVEKAQLAEEFPQPHVAIKVEYTEGFEGSNLLIIHTKDAKIIADLMLGGDGTNPAELLDEIHFSAVQEAMNQMMGSAATSMSTIFSKRVDISPPSIDMLHVTEGEGTENIPNDETLAKISFNLKVGNLIDSTIMQLLPFYFAKSLVNQLLNPDDLSFDDEVEQVKSTTPKQEVDRSKYEQPEAEVVKSTNQKTVGVEEEPQKKQKRTYDNVQPAEFSNFDQVVPAQTEPKNLQMLLDIPLKVTVELGRTRKTVEDILDLSPGSIVELDKLAGEPVDIFVNDKMIAKGEVVVIDENFGVRVTDIVSQYDRIKKLK